MTWAEFWTLTPRALRVISDSYYKKKEEELEEKNSIAHLQGKYVMDAIASTVGNMFGKGSNYHYPKKPYDISSKDGSSEEIAVFEMKQRTNSLKKMGMQESPK